MLSVRLVNSPKLLITDSLWLSGKVWMWWWESGGALWCRKAWEGDEGWRWGRLNGESVVGLKLWNDTGSGRGKAEERLWKQQEKEKRKGGRRKKRELRESWAEAGAAAAVTATASKPPLEWKLWRQMRESHKTRGVMGKYLRRRRRRRWTAREEVSLPTVTGLGSVSLPGRPQLDSSPLLSP